MSQEVFVTGLSQAETSSTPRSTGLQIGVNENVSNAVYHGDKTYLSSSVLKTIYKSLDDYYDQYILGNKKAFSNQGALDEGSYMHTLILEPHLAETDYAHYDGAMKSGAKFEEFKAIAGSKTIISKAQKQRCEGWYKAYQARKEAVELIKGCQFEHTVCGLLHGVPVKVRADAINVEAGYVADVKTTGYAADLESFKQTVDGLSYELSAALYSKVFELHYGKPFDFYFIVISKRDSQCHVYKTSQATMAKGMGMVTEALSKYRRAKQTGIWTEKASATPQLEIQAEGYKIEEV